MAEPTIADRKPKVFECQAGTYYWCACGQSDNQPYCDGHHQGTEFSPVAFEIAETRQVALCMCKQTDNQPYCDGSHSKL